jgi:hypothetical protein
MQAPLLNYLSPNESPRHLALKLDDEAVRVIFPVAPIWLTVSAMAIATFAGLAKIVMAIWIVLAMRGVFLQTPFPPTADALAFLRRFELGAFASAAPESIFWWSVAGFQWWKFRRYGRVPRVLTANHAGLALTWLGWCRMREKRWPAEEIAGIELWPVKGNLNWRRTVASLVVSLKNDRRRRFRLTSADPQLPNQIAKELSLALGCPLA